VATGSRDRSRLEPRCGASRAGALFLVAPPPPDPPVDDAEDEAIFQRTVDQTVEKTRRWQVERGDWTIAWDEAEGHLAILIDDVGRELHLFEQLQALSFPLTFSVLPGAVYAPGAQLRLRADRRRHREILLHLPCEPRDPAKMLEGADAEESFLRVGDPPDSCAGPSRPRCSGCRGLSGSTTTWARG
jgi:hypothetical protein